MKKEIKILVAEDNDELFKLIKSNLLEADLSNKILRFVDGRELLDFLFDLDKGPEGQRLSQGYIVLMELALPKVDGSQVLEKIKQDTRLKKIPVVILTAIDDQDTIDRCYGLSCSAYIVKPTECRNFEETIKSLGRFLSVIETTLIQ